MADTFYCQKDEDGEARCKKECDKCNNIVIEPEDDLWWLNPLDIISVISQSMYYISEVTDMDFTERQKINKDFSSILYRANRKVIEELKKQK